MFKFMIFCLLVMRVIATQQNFDSKYQQTFSNVQPPQITYSQQHFRIQRETEYYTFAAPEDFNDTKDVRRLAGFLTPQRVIFIRVPEKNIFSITAEQLAKKDHLNIFVLRRDSNTPALLSQLEEIRQRVTSRPNVNFIKYKTSEDIDRAKQAIFNDFESLPGSILYHEEEKIPVVEFDSRKPRQIYKKSLDTNIDSPVIYNIIKHQREPPRKRIQGDRF